MSEPTASFAAFTLYFCIAIAATWPLSREFWSRVAGDGTDPWQTLWGFWWWRHSTEFGDHPMRTSMLWWPRGASLWLQSFDIPSALLVWPLWDRLPHAAIYNLPLMLSFPLSGLSFYWLCRELHGGKLPAVLAGCIYTFSSYHFAHANACLHIASMQWTPLYLLGIHRIATRPNATAAGITGAAFALATLTSAYHFVFCIVATGVLAAWHLLLTTAPVALRKRTLKTAAFAACLGLGLSGWALWGMWTSYASGTYIGSHSPGQFSADVESFFLPNAVSRWASHISFWKDWLASRWSGATSLWADAAYVGYVALALACVAWWKGQARAWLAVAGVGAMLALGPQLQIGGVVYGGRMPYAWISELLPPIAFSGIPSRFAWLTGCGVAVAAGTTLSALCDRGTRGRAAAIALVLASLIESWPRPMITTAYPRPAILSTWADDRQPWVVLDTTWWSRALWHQTLHRHAIVGGYLTRPPEAAWRELERDPALSALVAHLFGKTPGPKVVAEQVVARLRQLNVRFVIVDETRAAEPRSLGLKEVFRGDSLVVFELPVQGVQTADGRIEGTGR